MPGPARFVRHIAADMANGKNVIVGLPPHAPTHLLEHLHRQPQPGIGANSWQFLSPPILTKHLSPAEWLWQHWKLNQDGPCPKGFSAQDLAQRPDFPLGQRVVLQDIEQEEWPRWFDFLDNYANQAQQTSLLRRTVFCCLVRSPAVLATHSQLRQAHARVHLYQNCCSQLDAQLFVSGNLNAAVQQSGRSALALEIRHELAAILFRNDPVAALRVAEMPEPQLSDLQEIIEDTRKTKGWTESKRPTPAEEWAHGWTDTFTQPIWRHPGAPYANSPRQWAEMALWQAQIRVLLPWLEQHRRELLRIPALQAALASKLPYTSTESRDPVTKYKIDTLELGEMHYLLEGCATLRALRGKVYKLKKCRNELSHLRPLHWSTIEELSTL